MNTDQKPLFTDDVMTSGVEFMVAITYERTGKNAALFQ